MLVLQFRTRLLTAFAAVSMLGCGTSSTSPLPDKIILFSTDPLMENVVKKDDGKERFLGFPVLGKIDITGERQRRKIIEGLKESIEKKPKNVPNCFSPRHGLKWNEDGKLKEYLIC